MSLGTGAQVRLYDDTDRLWAQGNEIFFFIFVALVSRQSGVEFTNSTRNASRRKVGDGLSLDIYVLSAYPAMYRIQRETKQINNYLNLQYIFFFVSRTQQGRQREPSVKTPRFPLSAEF